MQYIVVKSTPMQERPLFPYSRKCLEEKFCELRPNGVLRS
jgi:hypothetical protein